MFILTNFEFIVIHTLGSTHVVVDYLSQPEFNEASTREQDDLLDVYLFMIAAINVQANNLYDEMLQFF